MCFQYLTNVMGKEFSCEAKVQSLSALQLNIGQTDSKQFICAYLTQLGPAPAVKVWVLQRVRDLLTMFCVS